jgi:sortase A
MPDRRLVDDLSIEELEQILRVKKREARAQRLDHYARAGRRPGDPASDITEYKDEEPKKTAIPHRSFLSGSTNQKERTLRDKLLLAVEIGAALTLVAVLGYAFLSLQEINQSSAEAQSTALADLPTPSPTPIISVVVLPGGHTSPTDPGGAQPNYDEVPAYLRPQVEQQFLGQILLPTPGPSAAVRIEIPAIGVDAPVVQGDGWEQLKQGVGQHIGTANPGQKGNIVLSAHDDIYGEIFRYLDQLREGDEITLRTLTGNYIYEVVYSKQVEPTEISVMQPTTDSIVTLISCYPYLVNTHRIVVVGKLADQ